MSYSQAQVSDQIITAARNRGVWVTMQNGGVMNPNDPHIVRNSDGTWGWYNGTAEFGYATSFHPVQHNGLAALADDVEQALASAINDVIGDLVGIINSAEQDVSKVVNAVWGDLESFIEALPSSFATLVKEFIGLLVSIINQFGTDLDGLLQLGEFIVSISEQVLALVDPTGTSASRQAALDKLNPFKKGSPTYNFLTQDNYAAARRMMILLMVTGTAVFGYIILDSIFRGINPHLADLMSPARAADMLMNSISQIVIDIAAGKDLFTIIEDVINTILFQGGIKCSPACLLKLTYEVILGLPIPPIPKLITILLSDPVAQKSIADTLGIQALTNILPVAMTCFDAADAGQWLACFQDIVELVFPNIVNGLTKYAININDIRVLIDGVWKTGGDLSLMLGSTAINDSSSTSFGATDSTLSPMQAAMIGIGFFGVDFVASIAGFGGVGTFETQIIQLLPVAVQTSVRSSLDVFKLAQQLLIDAGKISSPISFKSPQITGLVLYLLESFHDAKWDVEIALSNIIMDEMDASSAAPKFFSSIIITKNGLVTVTPNLKALFTKLLNDFPRLKFMLDAVALKLGLKGGAADLLGTTADVNNALNNVKTSAPSLSTNTIAAGASSAGLTSSHPVVLHTSASAPQSAPKPATGTASALTGAAIGGAAGGLPGALLGAAASLLLGKKS